MKNSTVVKTLYPNGNLKLYTLDLLCDVVFSLCATADAQYEYYASLLQVTSLPSPLCPADARRTVQSLLLLESQNIPARVAALFALLQLVSSNRGGLLLRSSKILTSAVQQQSCTDTVFSFSARRRHASVLPNVERTAVPDTRIRPVIRFWCQGISALQLYSITAPTHS